MYCTNEIKFKLNLVTYCVVSLEFFMQVTISLRRYRLVITVSDKSHSSSIYLDFLFLFLIQSLLHVRQYELVKARSGRFYPEFAYKWQVHRKTFEGLGKQDLI